MVSLRRTKADKFPSSTEKMWGKGTVLCIEQSRHIIIQNGKRGNTASFEPKHDKAILIILILLLYLAKGIHYYATKNRGLCGFFFFINLKFPIYYSQNKIK